MKNKDWKRHVAYEALVILCMLGFLTFICRLWPILLLIILGIFIAAIRLLFLASRKVEVIQPQLALPEPVREPTERDVRDMAYAVILRRITELVAEDHPDARWVWAEPNAKTRIEQGEEVTIILNRAGGYRKAQVRIVNLQVKGLIYSFDPAPKNETPPAPTPPVPPKVNPDTEADADEIDDADTEKPAENYELLAFEWVEAHIMELNERCNEAIGNGLEELLLEPEELPVMESWPAICEELKRADLTDVVCDEDGIRIYLMQ